MCQWIEFDQTTKRSLYAKMPPKNRMEVDFVEKGVLNFQSLITRRICLQVPVYQRHYAWETDQWDDLWNDLYYLETGKDHYFGTIILMEKGTHEEMLGLRFEEFEIIDGQQRTATALILLAEIIARMEAVKGLPKANLRKLKEDYLRFKSVYKLELLGDDREFFRRYIIDGEMNPAKPVTMSQRRLLEAKAFFGKKLQEVHTANPKGFADFLLQLKQKVEAMEMMVYPLKETTEAARMFELVNDRGKDLTNLEKTKSYLMYMVYLSASPEEQERNLRDLNDCFGNIFRWIVEIQNSRYGKDIKEDSVQRYHFVTYAPEDIIPDNLTRADASYQSMTVLKDYIIQKYRANRKECLNAVLDYTLDIEKAFSFLKSILLYDGESSIKSLLEKVFILGRAANFYPLLISCWTRFKGQNEKLKEISHFIELMMFRAYAIGKRRADTGRGRLYDLAYKVHAGLVDYDETVMELKWLIRKYGSDWQFEDHLKADDFYDRTTGRDIRYLLYEYETYLRDVKGEPLEFTLTEILSRDDTGRPKYELEHIWPRSPSMLGLNKEELDVHEKCVNRLGNITLASKGFNLRMSNKPFKQKCKEYEDSLLRVQRDLTSNKRWGKKQIAERGKKIVEFALEKWEVH
ncbi:MAG: DUF262 domain-containing protein [Candidatus Bathyarchaeum sp.]|nr:MAG: DUF262 domain-containing protein [Candidatus Bathyarchaeum sp.]